MKLHLANLTGKPIPRILAAALWDGTRALCTECGLHRGEVTIILAGDRLLRRLNRDFRRLDEPTDVLAFSYREGEGAEEEPRPPFIKSEPPAVGDVYISLQRAGHQARQAGHPVWREVLLLGLHGLLHLLGWDHAGAEAEQAMRQKEGALLERFGTGRAGGGRA